MCDIFVPNSGFALCAKPWSWRSAEIKIMNFTVTDFKKKKKSINWQILKCHDFSGCSAEKPIWKCQYPSSPVILTGSRGSGGSQTGPRLLWLPQGRPLGCTPHLLQEDISPNAIWGSAHSTRRVKGVFWKFSWLDHPPGSPMQYLPWDRAFPGRGRTQGQHRVPWEQPAPPGSGG